MKISKLCGGTLFIVATILPTLASSQANVSRPRTGSPVVPGGAAIPGSQAVPILDPAVPAPDAVPGLELLDSQQRERRAAAAAAAAEESVRRGDGATVSVSPGGMNELQALIAVRLQIDSLASIELTQFAIERVTNSDVRQFAEALVTDQQHFWRALERLNELQSSGELPAPKGDRVGDRLENVENGQGSFSRGEQANPTQLGRTLPIERQIGQTPIGQTLPDQFPLSRRPPAQSLVPPADGGIRYGGTLPPAGGETRVPHGEVPGDSLPPPVPRATEPVRDTEPVQAAAPASNPLVTIADRAAQSQLAITKALLLRNEGIQFDQRFVAMQLAEQVRMLAQLRAVAEIGSDEFREIIETAEELTMAHLASAESLASRLDER